MADGRFLQGWTSKDKIMRINSRQKRDLPFL
jgi:hypothetical protein